MEPHHPRPMIRSRGDIFPRFVCRCLQKEKAKSVFLALEDATPFNFPCSSSPRSSELCVVREQGGYSCGFKENSSCGTNGCDYDSGSFLLILLRDSAMARGEGDGDCDVGPLLIIDMLSVNEMRDSQRSTHQK